MAPVRTARGAKGVGLSVKDYLRITVTLAVLACVSAYTCRIMSSSTITEIVNKIPNSKVRSVVRCTIDAVDVEWAVHLEGGPTSPSVAKPASTDLPCGLNISYIFTPASAVDIKCLATYDTTTAVKKYYDGCENENSNPCGPTPCEVRWNNNPTSFSVQSRDCGSMNCNSCAWCRRHFNYDHQISASAFANYKLWTPQQGTQVVFAVSDRCAAGGVTFSTDPVSLPAAWETAGGTLLAITRRPGYNFCDINGFDGLSKFNPCGTINPREQPPYPETLARLELRPGGPAVGIGHTRGSSQGICQAGTVQMWVDTELSPIFEYDCPAMSPQLMMVTSCGSATYCTHFLSTYNENTGQCHLAGEAAGCETGVIIKRVANTTDCTIREASADTIGGYVDQNNGVPSGLGGNAPNWDISLSDVKDIMTSLNPFSALIKAAGASNSQSFGWGTALLVLAVVVGAVACLWWFRAYRPRKLATKVNKEV